jgi:hypothetical protein
MYTPVVIDYDVPYAEFKPTFESLEERVAAALNSLQSLGVEPMSTPEEARLARKLFSEGGAMDAELEEPGVIAHLGALLNEYDKQVVASAAQLRTYITNRLLLETNNQQANVRLRALEMLGKISDVGLFTDKTEITMRHRPTAELEQLLRERLTKVIEAEAEIPEPISPRKMELAKKADAANS